MTVKVAINGYGRIGRNVLKALFESGRTSELEIVALNDLGDADSNAYLTKYDTAHGIFPFDVEVKGDALAIDGKEIKVFAERDPEKANPLEYAIKGYKYLTETLNKSDIKIDIK